MKERPILFSAPMVRAIIAGTKMQTRRAIRLTDSCRVKQPGSHRNWHLDDPEAIRACPYGVPGDRLWVRETHQAFEVGYVHYAADYTRDPKGEREHGVRWTPSIYMPRWASRITLEITEVRVERLQYIDDRDARDEGAEQVGDCEGAYVAGFRRLWESINGPDSWAANPWVWVIHFRRLDAEKQG